MVRYPQIESCRCFCLLPGTDKSFPRPVVTPEDLVVLRNEEAMLHCQFTAVPPPTLEWYHETELLANKSRYIERRITHSPQISPNLPFNLFFFFFFPSYIFYSPSCVDIMSPPNSLSLTLSFYSPTSSILRSFFQPNEAEYFCVPKMDSVFRNIILGTEAYSSVMLLCVSVQLLHIV